MSKIYWSTQPEACQVEKLQVGELVLLDAIFGVEEIVRLTTYTLQNGVVCTHLEVKTAWPSGDATAPERVYERFAVRAQGEPCLHFPIIQSSAP